MKTKTVILALFLGALCTLQIAQASTSQVPRERCAAALASLADSKLMSKQTALRKARKLCDQIEKSDRYFFRALVQ